MMGENLGVHDPEKSHQAEENLDRLVVRCGTSYEVRTNTTLRATVALGHACLSFLLACDAASEEFRALATKHSQKLEERWTAMPASLQHELEVSYGDVKKSVSELTDSMQRVTDSTLEFAGEIAQVVERVASRPPGSDAEADP